MHPDNVATRCLRAEGLKPEVHVLTHEQGYAQLVAKLWRDGETFVLVEDDVAPWPGAVTEMLNCSHHWCGHHYALPGRWDFDGPNAMWGTCGCCKVSETVMQAAPDLYERWDVHDWHVFDVGFVAALRHVFGLEGTASENTFHVHTPPVAHAMHYRPEVSNGRGQEQRVQERAQGSDEVHEGSVH
jgi:hypothetical protein